VRKRPAAANATAVAVADTAIHPHAVAVDVALLGPSDTPDGATALKIASTTPGCAAVVELLLPTRQGV